MYIVDFTFTRKGSSGSFLAYGMIQELQKALDGKTGFNSSFIDSVTLLGEQGGGEGEFTIGLKMVVFTPLDDTDLKELFEKVIGNEVKVVDVLNNEACDIYDSYVGGYGLYGYDECLEMADGDEDEADIIYADHRESWLDYYAEKVEE